MRYVLFLYGDRIFVSWNLISLKKKIRKTDKELMREFLDILL